MSSQLAIPLSSLKRPVTVILGPAETKPAPGVQHFAELETEWLKEVLAETGMAGESSKFLNGKLELTAEAQVIRTRGALKMQPALECVRCLKEFRPSIDVAVNAIFTPTNLKRDETKSSENAPHRIFSEEYEENADIETYMHNGKNIVLDALILDSIETCLPDFPLCKEDCLGLCGTCGNEITDVSGCLRCANIQ